jgi:hypothetical protein
VPTPSEQRVLDKLHYVKGNVQLAATELGVSESWVNRIKVSLWAPRDTALVVADPEPEPHDFLDDILPTNFSEVAELRDEAISFLRAQLKSGLIDAKDVVGTLNVLLKYERDVHKVVAPAVGVFNDNRQVQFTNLVDKLADLQPEALRALSGVPAPMIAEGIIIEETKNDGTA